MSSLDILEFYWEMPYVVGLSLKSLKENLSQEGHFEKSFDVDNIVNNFKKHLTAIKYDYHSSSWFQAIKGELIPFCQKLQESCYNLKNDKTLKDAAYLFNMYGLNGDGTSLHITASNMGGEGAKNSINTLDYELNYFKSQSHGFWGEHTGNEQTPHHPRAIAPFRPAVPTPLKENAQPRKFEYEQQVKINYFAKNPMEFRKEFLYNYNQNLFPLKNLTRIILNKSNVWNKKRDFTINNVLAYAHSNPTSKTCVALIKMNIKKFELQPDFSIQYLHNEYLRLKKAYNEYKQACVYWKSNVVPYFWEPHLRKLNMWPPDD